MRDQHAMLVWLCLQEAARRTDALQRKAAEEHDRAAAADAAAADMTSKATAAAVKLAGAEQQTADLRLSLSTQVRRFCGRC